jgi:hypothetical protein
MASSIATPDAAQKIANEVDEFVTLQIEKGNHLHGIFDPVSDDVVKDMLESMKCQIALK